MNTTKLNKTTARAEGWINHYFNSDYYSVEQFYNRPSYNKIRAENGCINRMNSINGKGYKVLGGNSSFFTCGYMNETRDILYIETAYNIFEIDLK